jgi:hypothetical protein
MERIWLKFYPGGAPAEINADAFGSIGLHGERREVPRPDRLISMGQAISFDELERLSAAIASYLQNIASLPLGARVAR